MIFQGQNFICVLTPECWMFFFNTRNLLTPLRLSGNIIRLYPPKKTYVTFITSDLHTHVLLVAPFQDYYFVAFGRIAD